MVKALLTERAWLQCHRDGWRHMMEAYVTVSLRIFQHSRILICDILQASGVQVSVVKRPAMSVCSLCLHSQAT